MRERIPVVVRGRRARRPLGARLLWGGAELVVTLGAVVLLLVAHQLWWTNREARASARDEVAELERGWTDESPTGPSTAPEDGRNEPSAGSGSDSGSDSDSDSGPSPEKTRSVTVRIGESPPRRDAAYAVIRIPKIGVTAPVAQGISKAGVLNKGYVGHYVHTAQPGRRGNFALAGHRNTHGEPFRRLDRLRPGDTVRIDTDEARYTYTIERTLPQTSPADGTVIAPVPYSSAHPAYRYAEPGSYLTLTTCTPEFTSKYRLVVWGRLTATEPR
ncbi:class E sortase [Streptomyces sp. NPDC050610]|uniref:class E sortase n=1 Tax=Streptomyces sp. NPDC050610 TaxID=3157097 RepID=UPI003438A7FF